MLDGLAFLPLERVIEGLHHLRNITPDGLEELINYFDKTYVTGYFRQIRRPPINGQVPAVILRAVPPSYPPRLWNVHAVTVNNDDRTNNSSEGWNNSFATLVGHQHPSFAKTVEALQRDAAVVSTMLLQNDRGEPPRKRVRQATAQLQLRLRRAVELLVNNEIQLPEFLRSIRHLIRF